MKKLILGLILMGAAAGGGYCAYECYVAQEPEAVTTEEPDTTAAEKAPEAVD